jgi:hypothetical protein
MSEALRLLSEEALLRQCRWDTFRSGGPGGQKRQKTSNGVRLVHEPTSISATATESRSLQENRLYAIRRLRLKLAIELRAAIDLTTFEPPTWFESVRRGNQIEVSHRHPLFAAVAGLVLDLLEATQGNPSHVAINLGVSTTAVIKVLEKEPALWGAANGLRARFGLTALTRRG